MQGLFNEHSGRRHQAHTDHGGLIQAEGIERLKADVGSRVQRL
jgi:hypothetical protein